MLLHPARAGRGGARLPVTCKYATTPPRTPGRAQGDAMLELTASPARGGQADGEGAALAEDAGGAHLAAVAGDNLLDDVEPDPHP